MVRCAQVLANELKDMCRKHNPVSRHKRIDHGMGAVEMDTGFGSMVVPQARAAASMRMMSSAGAHGGRNLAVHTCTLQRSVTSLWLDEVRDVDAMMNLASCGVWLPTKDTQGCCSPWPEMLQADVEAEMEKMHKDPKNFKGLPTVFDFYTEVCRLARCPVSNAEGVHTRLPGASPSASTARGPALAWQLLSPCKHEKILLMHSRCCNIGNQHEKASGCMVRMAHDALLACHAVLLRTLGTISAFRNSSTNQDGPSSRLLAVAGVSRQRQARSTVPVEM